MIPRLRLKIWGYALKEGKTLEVMITVKQTHVQHIIQRKTRHHLSRREARRSKEWKNAAVKGETWYQEEVQQILVQTTNNLDSLRITNKATRHVLHAICQESRGEALKVLHPLFDVTQAGATHIYYNPKVDTICFPQIEGCSGVLYNGIADGSGNIVDWASSLSNLLAPFSDDLARIELLELRGVT